MVWNFIKCQGDFISFSKLFVKGMFFNLLDFKWLLRPYNRKCINKWISRRSRP